MLAQNIYWTSIVSIYFTLNKSNVCECPKFHSLFMSVSLALVVCTAPSVHKHTYSHAFCFPFVCAVIRALCAMGASFHAKYTFQIVVCLCCLSIFFERWRVLSTIETCVYMDVYKRKSDLFAMKRHRFQLSIYNIFICIYIFHKWNKWTLCDFNFSTFHALIAMLCIHDFIRS